MNITEDECPECGSTLEEVRPGKWQCVKCELDQMRADQYNAGYQAGSTQSQRDDDNAFWLRQYAGMAMQGILASNTADTRIECLPAACVAVAKALLEEVKKHETCT